MTQAKVIISKTQVFVTDYSKNGATIIFMENHNCDSIEHAWMTDVAAKAMAVAYRQRNEPIVQEDATQDQVLAGKFNNRFL